MPQSNSIEVQRNTTSQFYIASLAQSGSYVFLQNRESCTQSIKNLIEKIGKLFLCIITCGKRKLDDTQIAGDRVVLRGRITQLEEDLVTAQDGARRDTTSAAEITQLNSTITQLRQDLVAARAHPALVSRTEEPQTVNMQNPPLPTGDAQPLVSHDTGTGAGIETSAQTQPAGIVPIFRVLPNMTRLKQRTVTETAARFEAIKARVGEDAYRAAWAYFIQNNEGVGEADTLDDLKAGRGPATRLELRAFEAKAEELRARGSV